MESKTTEAAERTAVGGSSRDTGQGRSEPATYWVESLVYTSTRSTATEALRRLGKAAVPALDLEFEDGNNRVRAEAALVLEPIDAEAAPSVRG